MAMDPNMKTEWVNALRSSHYRQGSSRMRRKRGDKVYFCCLGVLQDACDLDRKEYPVIKEGFDKLALYKLGIPESYQSELIKMNDDHRWDFSIIADYIEDNL